VPTMTHRPISGSEYGLRTATPNEALHNGSSVPVNLWCVLMGYCGLMLSAESSPPYPSRTGPTLTNAVRGDILRLC